MREEVGREKELQRPERKRTKDGGEEEKQREEKRRSGSCESAWLHSNAN